MVLGFESQIPEISSGNNQFFENDGSDKETRKSLIIPYYGETQEESHKWLYFQQAVSDNSPSVGAIKDALVRNTFGAGIDFQKSMIPGYRPQRTNTEDIFSIGDADKDALVEKMMSWNMTPAKLLKAARCLEKWSIDNDNTWFKIRLFSNSGNWRFNIYPIHPRHVGYWYKTKKSEDIAHTAVYAKTWNPQDWKKDKSRRPQLLPVTRYGIDEEFNWLESTELGADVYETLVHVVPDECRGEFYAPSRIDRLCSRILTEVNYNNLDMKISSTEIITRNILLFEKTTDKPGESEGFKLMMNKVNRFMAQSADKVKNLKSIMGIRYPKGSEKPENIQLDVNRSESFESYAKGDAVSDIYSILGWSRLLTNKTEAPGGIGADKILNEYIIYKSVIDTKREEYANLFTFVLQQVHLQITGQETDAGVVFNDMMGNIINEMKESVTRRSNNQ